MNTRFWIVLLISVAALVGVVALLQSRGPAGGDAPEAREPGTGPDDGGREEGEEDPMAAGVRAILEQGPSHPGFPELIARAGRLDPTQVRALLDFVADPSMDEGARVFAVGLLQHVPGEGIGDALVDVVAGEPQLPDPLEMRIYEVIRDRGQDGPEVASRILSLTGDPAFPPDRLWLKSEAARWLGQDTTSRLREIVREDDPMRRVGAARALLFVGQGGDVAPEFDAALRREEDPAVRTEMLDALSLRRDAVAQRYALGLLDDPDLDAATRAHAADVVGRIDDGEAQEKLLRILARGTAPDEVLEAAARAVGRVREPQDVARRVQESLLESPRDSARIAAANALRLSGDREGLPDVRRALVDARGGSPELRAALARSLGELGGRADRGTLETMKESDLDPAVREAAAKGLARLDEILLSWPDR